MRPADSTHRQVEQLTDLPNIGKAMARDLHQLGIQQPADLIGQDPYAMYDRLCAITGCRHDLCVLDVFISITDYMHGGTAQPWWHYTAERKRHRKRQPT